MRKNLFSINGRFIGPNYEPYIIAEMSANHNGSVERAIQIIEMCKKNLKRLNNLDISINTLEKVIFARTEEILELCFKSSDSNLYMNDKLKMVLMGEGSKILDNQHKDKISFLNSIDFLEETLEDICQSGLKFITGINKQEVVVVPKRLIKQGFFEKFFHLFK